MREMVEAFDSAATSVIVFILLAYWHGIYFFHCTTVDGEIS